MIVMNEYILVIHHTVTLKKKVMNGDEQSTIEK